MGMDPQNIPPRSVHPEKYQDLLAAFQALQSRDKLIAEDHFGYLPLYLLYVADGSEDDLPHLANSLGKPEGA